MSERWTPEYGEMYWVVDTENIPAVMQVKWVGCRYGHNQYCNGNYFKTREEAEAAAEKVRALLLSLHETVTECNQLPKLTTEVFDRPDCPEWAKYAAVSSDGRCLVCREYPIMIGGRRWANPESYWEKTIDGKFDASDWENSLIELPARLPDWCKVGEWCYCLDDDGNGKYFKITKIKDNYIYGEDWDIDYHHIRQARLRPYNAEEMKALVGKVLKHSTGVYLVTAFENRWDQVKIESIWREPSELAELWTQLDGKPCGVYEHLENGEWVE